MQPSHSARMIEERKTGKYNLTTPKQNLTKWKKELNANTSALDSAGKEMDNVGKSADDMSEDIEDATKSAEKSEGKFSGLGSALKSIGAAMVAVGVAATAIAVKLGKEVVSAYADYEQLVGGVKTLFGTETSSVEEYAKSVGKSVDEVRDEYNSLLTTQETVMKNADNAYKTASLSANEYMETVTSFSASLIASLNGDTEAVATKANQAIVDMADNANKKGTDMSMIQSAYQGFAKQNYTMQDNLKLGYGGTKTEMERLLADASEIAGVEFSIDSYADIVDAIHVIQTQMGITGTTAKEAVYTITGSINSLKSALQNLITGFGNSEADIQSLCDNVVEGFQTVVRNITPIIGNIISALPTAVDELIDAVGDLLPTMLAMVTNLFSRVLKTLLDLLPNLVPAAMDALLTIVDTLIKNLPLIIDAGIKLFVTLIQALPEIIEMILTVIPKIITSIVGAIIDNIPLIIQAGIELFTSLIANLPTIIIEIVKPFRRYFPQS